MKLGSSFSRPRSSWCSGDVLAIWGGTPQESKMNSSMFGARVAQSGPKLELPKEKLSSNHARKYKSKFKFCFFGHCLAKLGPETHSNGSGSTNGAERTKISPGDQF